MIQLACLGPEDEKLYVRPEITYWKNKPLTYGDFSETVQETRPLQTFVPGRMSVFPIPHVGDHLGDVFLEISVPAEEQLLGTDLPPFSYASSGVPGVVTTPVEYGSVRVFLDRMTARPPILSSRYVLATGGEVHSFEWQDGLRWQVCFYTSGRLESTLTSPYPDALVQPCTVTVQVSPTVSGSWVQRVGRGAAVMVSQSLQINNGTWSDALALTLMRRARLVINDVTVHDHERLWYHLLDRIRLRCGLDAGFAEMLGASSYPLLSGPGISKGRAHTLYLPLKFLCCTDVGGKRAFFPLSLVPAASLRVELDSEKYENLDPSQGPATRPPWSVVMLTHHYTVSAAERAATRGKPTSLLYEDCQDMDGANYTVGMDDTLSMQTNVTVDLQEVNVPVSFLAWTAFIAGSRLFHYEADWVRSSTLQFDGVERQFGLPGLYRRIQPWRHAGRCDRGDDLYMYSFGLDVSQGAGAGPKGALTSLNSMTYPTLRLTTDNTRPLQVKVWACTYNILLIDKGTVRPTFVA